MAMCPWSFQVGQVTEGLRHLSQLGCLDLDLRLGLDREHALSWVSGASLGEQFIHIRDQRLDDRGVEDPAGAMPQRVHHGLGATEVIESRGIGRGAGDPGRTSDLLTLEPLGRALAVPPFDLLLQRPLGARAEPDAPRGRAGHLTAAGVEVPAEVLSLPAGGELRNPGALRGALSLHRDRLTVPAMSVASATLVLATALSTCSSSPQAAAVSCERALHPTCVSSTV